MDIVTRPAALNLCVVTTAGIPVRLTTGVANQTRSGITILPYGNFTAVGGSGNIEDDLFARRIDFRAPTDSPGGVNTNGNTGRVYVGQQNMNRATFAGVLFWLDPGEAWTLDNAQQAQPYHVGDLYVDAEVSGEGVLAMFDPS